MVCCGPWLDNLGSVWQIQLFADRNPLNNIIFQVYDPLP